MTTRMLACLLSGATMALCLPAQTLTIPLGPRATFLRTNLDSPTPPLVLDLAVLGVSPGTWLRIGTVGTYSGSNGAQDVTRSLVGVFSAGNTLLATNVQQRVPGAIAAGPAYVSANTYRGGLPMDIPQDFCCSRTGWGDSMVVEVPAGATHLFLGVNDRLYVDNTDPNGDYAAVVTVLPTPPLPGTGEHLELRGAVDATPTYSPSLHQAPAGSMMQVELAHPVGFADGATLVLIADLLPTGAIPGSALPRIWSTDPIVLLVSTVPSTPGWTLPVSIQAPPGRLGTTLLLQAGALLPTARNGWYETTTAHRFELQ